MQSHYPLVRAALNPLLALSFSGMAVAGGYLLYEGYIGAMWLVALTLFAAPLVFPFLMVPAAVCGNFMVMFEKKKKPGAALLMQCLSVGWLVFVMAFWGAEVFDLSDGAYLAGGVSRAAALVWSVSGAGTPWAVFARGDRDNVFFTGMVLMLWTGALVAAVSGLREHQLFWDRFGVIAGVMVLLALTQALYEKFALKKKKRRKVS